MKKFLLSLIVLFICFFSIESSYAYETPFCPTCGKVARWIQAAYGKGHGIYCNFCPDPYDPAYPQPHKWGIISQRGGNVNNSVTYQATSNMVPNHCPEDPNGTLTGNLLDKLFYVGEKISLYGTKCRETNTYSERIVEKECKICGIRDKSTNKIPSETVEYNISISVEGIELIDKSGNPIPKQMTMTEKEWRTGDFYIKEWKNTNYSSTLGTFYGTITVKSECLDGCAKIFYIPGPKPVLSNVEVIINISPSNAGRVDISYQQIDKSGIITTKTETITGERGTISAIAGTNVSVNVNENDNYMYTCTSSDEMKQNVITNNKNYSYQIPNVNSELYVNFERMYSVKFESEPVGIGTIPSNIDSILPGEEVGVFATPGEGYFFSSWKLLNENRGELSIEVKERADGTKYFIMPNESVIVVALFSNKPNGTVKIIIEGEGEVTVDGTKINSGDIVPGEDGTTIDIISKPSNDGCKEIQILDENREVIGTGEEYIYTIDGDTTIIVKFISDEDGKDDKDGKYTLYVTSFYGGDAKIEKVLSKHSGATYKIEKEGPDALGKYVYKIKNVYAGDRFKIGYEVKKEEYSFKNWEYKPYIKPDKSDSNGSKGSIEITMPESDLTVTAIFEEKVVSNTATVRVSTNNELWGDAWIVVDGKEYRSEWVEVEAGKDYKVYYESKGGFKFTNWNMTEYFTEYVFGARESNLNMPNNKIELTAFFAPGASFSVQVQANPKDGGQVSIDGMGEKRSNILVGDQVKIAASLSNGWSFQYWYIEDNGTREIISEDEEYTFNMPPRDLTVIAEFNKNGSGNNDPNEKYTVTVVKEGSGSGSISYDEGNGFVDSVFGTVMYVDKGKTIKFKVTPDSDSYIEGWFRGLSKVSTKNEYSVGPINENISIRVGIYNKDPNGGNEPTDPLRNSFRIVSVRDLRWKDYFIKGTTLDSNKAFSIPKTNTTMLYDVDKYTQPIKMGYAVEFELITEGIEDAELVITPRAYATDDKSNNLIDRLDTENDDMRDYKEIRISKNSNGKGKFLQYSEDLGEKVNIGGYEIDKNKTLWRWVYYLPADTWLKGGGKDEITVAFDIKLVENGSKKRDIVVNAQKVMSSSWTGDAFKYSLKHSLLEDIYNNAQN